MAKVYDAINEKHREFIERQHLFFVASAPLSAEGHVNLSPKGLDSFRVLSPNRVMYLDMISSGNETAAHVLENGRITFMFCAFEGPPNILRLYGMGRPALPGDAEWDDLRAQFGDFPAVRQIIVADIHRVQTSCGFGVPLYEYVGERPHHFDWAEKKGPEGLIAYRSRHNLISIDGLPTPHGLREEAEGAPGPLVT